MGIDTSWVSRFQPLGKSGRSGRSIMRAVSVAFSPALPSRRKNEPGILPAAYMRSSTSTVSGRKSTSRSLPAVAVQRTIVSPERTTTDPLAWRASFPVSKEISSPPTSTETRVTSNMLICGVSLPAARLAAAFALRTVVLCRGDVSGRRLRGAPLGERGRRSRDAGADPADEIPLDPFANRLRAAIRVELLEVEAEALRAFPEVGIVDAAAIRIERVAHLPERALHPGGLRGGMKRRSPRVLRGHRKVPEAEPQRQLPDLGPRSR